MAAVAPVPAVRETAQGRRTARRTRESRPAQEAQLPVGEVDVALDVDRQDAEIWRSMKLRYNDYQRKAIPAVTEPGFPPSPGRPSAPDPRQTASRLMLCPVVGGAIGNRPHRKAFSTQPHDADAAGEAAGWDRSSPFHAGSSPSRAHSAAISACSLLEWSVDRQGLPSARPVPSRAVSAKLAMNSGRQSGTRIFDA